MQSEATLKIYQNPPTSELAEMGQQGPKSSCVFYGSVTLLADHEGRRSCLAFLVSAVILGQKGKEVKNKAGFRRPTRNEPFSMPSITLNGEETHLAASVRSIGLFSVFLEIFMFLFCNLTILS